MWQIHSGLHMPAYFSTITYTVITMCVFVCVQMVWARTYALGCGAHRCAELEGAEDANENALFLVCHYGPGSVSQHYG